MHIAYIIAPGGGPEAYVRTLLPWLQARGHAVSIVYIGPPFNYEPIRPAPRVVAFAPAGQIHYYLSKAVGSYHAWPRRVRTWETAWAVAKALARLEGHQKVDLVEVPEGMPLAFLARGRRVVVRAHASSWTVDHFCGEADTSNDRWLVAIEAQQLRDADGVGALSQHLAKHLSEFCDFPIERISVIPYPIDTQSFLPATQVEAKGVKSILTIGRLERRKGTDILLRALAPRVWEKHPDLQVCILGSEGDLSRSDLLDLVPYSRRTRVIFPGFISRERIAEYFRQASLYVAPTLYETFGYTILEAMSSGLPVLASRVGGIPELVDDGVTGLLVPPRDERALADAIIALLDDPVRRARMGQCGREKATAQYDIARIGPRTLEFYGRALVRAENGGNSSQ